MTHAPYALLGDLVILYGKTTKTACKKRVATVKLAKRGEQTCPDCTAQIAADRAEMEEMQQAVKDLGL